MSDARRKLFGWADRVAARGRWWPAVGLLAALLAVAVWVLYDQGSLGRWLGDDRPSAGYVEPVGGALPANVPAGSNPPAPPPSK